MLINDYCYNNNYYNIIIQGVSLLRSFTLFIDQSVAIAIGCSYIYIYEQTILHFLIKSCFFYIL